MKRAAIGGLLIAVAVLTALGTGGCATGKQKPLAVADASLQGSWEGKEIGSSDEGTCRLMISGSNLEFRGSHPSEWYKGTFATQEDAVPKRLVGFIKDCPAPEYVGKNVQAIYKLNGSTLTLTGSEPGRAEIPADFEAPGTRTFVLKKL